MAAEGGQRRTPERILVVTLDSIGDLVFASALLPPLRENFPSAHIAIWCKQYVSGLGPLLPAVDTVYSADPFWDRAPGEKKGSPPVFMRTAASIRRAGFDTAIVCFAPWRTAAAVSATAIPVRIGLERSRNRRWLTHPLPPEDRNKPVLMELSRLLEPLHIRAAPLRYRLDVTELEAERNATKLLLGGDSYVALHPFASNENRCVELSTWEELARELSDQGLSPLWIGTHRELERLRKATAPRSNWRYADVLFGGSLTTTALAISIAKLFIGHDSGPLHVASALGVPSVGVFAPGEPARTFPQGVGPWRVIARPSPRDVTARDILGQVRNLLESS
jgi:ADP-heptose:LPS heptosyltransferase